MDDVMLGYVEWREESAAVQAAYDRWSSADREDTVCAHAAYRAALDREEAAATIYAEVIERVRAVWRAGSDQPLTPRAPFDVGT